MGALCRPPTVNLTYTLSFGPTSNLPDAKPKLMGRWLSRPTLQPTDAKADLGRDQGAGDLRELEEPPAAAGECRGTEDRIIKTACLVDSRESFLKPLYLERQRPIILDHFASILACWLLGLGLETLYTGTIEGCW